MKSTILRMAAALIMTTAVAACNAYEEADNSPASSGEVTGNRAATLDEATTQTTCTVSVTCPNGQTLSCTGYDTCGKTQYSVYCDGSGYMCPCTINCSVHSNCDQYCGGPSTGYCEAACGKKYCKCLL